MIERVESCRRPELVAFRSGTRNVIRVRSKFMTKSFILSATHRLRLNHRYFADAMRWIDHKIADGKGSG